jgi:hypothetical protein
VTTTLNYLVDTGVFILYFRGDRRAVDFLRQTNAVIDYSRVTRKELLHPPIRVSGSMECVLVALELLHSGQASQRFSSADVPPAARGMICSTCIGMAVMHWERCRKWQDGPSATTLEAAGWGRCSHAAPATRHRPCQYLRHLSRSQWTGPGGDPRHRKTAAPQDCHEGRQATPGNAAGQARRVATATAVSAALVVGGIRNSQNCPAACPAHARADRSQTRPFAWLRAGHAVARGSDTPPCFPLKTTVVPDNPPSAHLPIFEELSLLPMV